MASTKFNCLTCDDAPTFQGCETCLACTAAYYIHEDPEQLVSARRIFAGTPWLLTLEREISRQLGATLPAGHQVAA